nr:PREDICTED: C-type lectin domain family 4 member G isoform X2 [Rhinolophus sinicus]
MDTVGYSKWDGKCEEASGGYRGCWGRRLVFLALALLVVIALWAFILSVLLSKASTQRGALFGSQDLLKTNASEQRAALGALKKEIGVCNSCCLRTEAQLQNVRTEVTEAQEKLIQQESSLKELSERVTQSLAEAARDREGIRSELYRALEAARFGNSSCEQCPTRWLPFQGSCYFISALRAKWVDAQRNCSGESAHLVIVGGLEEQAFLSRNTGNSGYWLGLRAVRRQRKIQGYQWVDGVPLSFRLDPRAIVGLDTPINTPTKPLQQLELGRAQ